MYLTNFYIFFSSFASRALQYLGSLSLAPGCTLLSAQIFYFRDDILRVCFDNYSLHAGTLRGHLPPYSLAKHHHAVACRQNDRRHLGDGLFVRVAVSASYRTDSHTPPDHRWTTGIVHHVQCTAPLVATDDVHFPDFDFRVLSGTDDNHYCSLYPDWGTPEKFGDPGGDQ